MAYQAHLHRLMIREQRERAIRFLLDDNEAAIKQLQEHTKNMVDRGGE